MLMKCKPTQRFISCLELTKCAVEFVERRLRAGVTRYVSGSSPRLPTDFNYHFPRTVLVLRTVQ